MYKKKNIWFLTIVNNFESIYFIENNGKNRMRLLDETNVKKYIYIGRKLIQF